MTIEQKVIAKIRSLFIADSTISGYVQDRFYSSHISSIQEPVYPAVSLFRMSGKAWFNVPVVSDMMIQIDFWFQAADNNPDDIQACVEAARDILNVQSITDSTITFMSIVEVDVPGLGFEQDIKVYHQPMIYRVAAR